MAMTTLLAVTTVVADDTAALEQQLDRLESRLERLEQTSGSNQTEAPSALGSSTTLVDHASASDLIGLALNPATFPRSETDEAEATSQTITISPYTILAALTGRNPDDPWVYQDATVWRLFAISLGLEDADVLTLGRVRAPPYTRSPHGRLQLVRPRRMRSVPADALRGRRWRTPRSWLPIPPYRRA